MDPVLLISLATAAAGTILLIRMVLLGQGGKFPGLTFYLGQHIFWGYALAAVPHRSRAYLLIYELSNPIEWIAATWCVIHLLGKAFAAYPGIRTASRWATWGATTLSVMSALIMARFFWDGNIRGKRLLFYFEVTDRSVLLSLALVVILTLAFLSRFPLRLQMNTWASLIGFSAVVLSLAGVRLLDSLAPMLAAMPADHAQLIFETCTYLTWAWLLQSEDAQAPAHVIFHHSEEQELLRQLEALNGILRRAGRS